MDSKWELSRRIFTLNNLHENGKKENFEYSKTAAFSRRLKMNEDLRLFFEAKKHAALIDEAAVRKSICGKVANLKFSRGSISA
jgi:hypothetical protein